MPLAYYTLCISYKWQTYLINTSPAKGFFFQNHFWTTNLFNSLVFHAGHKKFVYTIPLEYHSKYLLYHLDKKMSLKNAVAEKLNMIGLVNEISPLLSSCDYILKLFSFIWLITCCSKHQSGV